VDSEPNHASTRCFHQFALSHLILKELEMNSLQANILELVIQTSTNLPSDVREVISKAALLEKQGSRSGQAMSIINKNIDMACDSVLPICQDTGMPTFFIHCPVTTNQIEMKKAIHWAIDEATRQGKLRPNSVNSITGRNSGNNLGPGSPVVHFEQWEKDEIEIMLLLKGGGCENKNIQYSVPCELEGIGRANRDLDGVHKCILHAVYQAQGQGCSAGILGVCIGGDRTSGYNHAKEQLLRSMNDTNPIPELAKLESAIMEEANKLGIGTMGFGGNVTLLGCKIGALNRLPACFFVSVAYNCWAYRRMGVKLDPDTFEIKEWIFRDSKPQPMVRPEEHILTGTEIRLTTPLSEEQVRKLKVGDVVSISGPMHTGRDALHKYLTSHDSPVDLQGAALYHCGPVMVKDENGRWRVNAAGPTTSIREEPYQADILKKFGIRAVIGKGGMGAKTLKALQDVGAVYLNAIGGAAQFYAQSIPDVIGVDFLEEFGVPEAMWHLQAQDFIAVVTMDSHGNSLHKDIEVSSLHELEKIAG
jgi:fumarate hydratase class I